MSKQPPAVRAGRALVKLLGVIAAIPNIHGRKPTRGIRPWLLLPKVLAVFTLLGGLLAALILICTSDPRTPADWRYLERTLTRLYHWMVVPGAVASIMLGVMLLLADGWRIMLRQRWLQVKLALLAVAIPGLHTLSRGLLLWIRYELVVGEPDGPHGLLDALGSVTAAGVAVLVVVIILGRLKPRLGQNWARAYPKPQATE